MLPLVVISLQLLTWHYASGFNLDVENAYVLDGTAGSYFGFSVALLNNTAGSWLIAGAPLDQEQQRSSGGIYKCPLLPATGSRDCQKIALSQTGFGPAGNLRIGTSMDVPPVLKDKIVYCGYQPDPRATNPANATIYGMCYELMKDLDYRRSSRVSPMTLGRGLIADKDGQFLDGENDAKIYYFPIHNSEGNTLIVGTPASQNGKGAVVLYRGNRRLKRKVFPQRGGYAGFSLSSGRLFRDPRLYYLVGAPGTESKGKVYILGDSFDVIRELAGDQESSYFGAAITAVDLNGDGLDDIVVGAPLYSRRKEEGAVYVYVNQNEKPFEKVDFLLMGSSVPGAKFGSAIENIGDMNRDTFEDIAIGAPFEDEGKGVVYIYNGNSEGIGLRGAYSQRIAARDLSDGLQGFGMSFSRVDDIDGNSYRDLAVGAPQSDSAVVFRSKPVADLQPRFRVNPAIIDPGVMNCRYQEKRATCIRIEACFVFRGYHLPAYLDVDFSLSVDTLMENKRVQLMLDDRLESQGNNTLRVSSRRTACNKYTALVLPSARDVFTPVVFNLNFDLVKDQRGDDQGVGPVLSAFRSKSNSTELLFRRDCGQDNECHSDLVVTTRLLYPSGMDYLIVGKDESLSLEVKVLNSGEAAYMSTVVVTFSDNIAFLSSPRSRIPCALKSTDSSDASMKKTSQVSCDVGNPIGQSSEIAFQLVFDARQLTPMSSPIQISTKASTASQDTNLVNNVRKNRANVRFQASTHLSGTSVPGELAIQRGAPNTDPVMRKVSHAYELLNLGPSVLKRATVWLTIPLGNLTSDQVAVDRVQVEGSEGGRGKCKQIASPSTPPQNETEDAQMDQGQSNRCPDSACFAVRCLVKNLEKDQTILFTADIVLVDGVENDIMADSINLMTSAEVIVPGDTVFVNIDRFSKEYSVSTPITLSDYVEPESTPEIKPEPEVTAEPNTDSETEPNPESETEAETGETVQGDNEEGAEEDTGAASISYPIIPLLVILTTFSRILL